MLGLAVLGACLSDDRASSLHGDSESAGGAGDSGGAALAPPPGGIIDTQPQSGWTEGILSVNHNGAAEYHLPLWVPDGRGGLEPELALHYNSQGGNGLLGVGWSLSAGLSSIAPCARTWAQDGTSRNPDFEATNAYCLDGQRLRPTDLEGSAEQDYRTERETFARIRAYSTGEPNRPPNQFKVWTKDGRVMTYDPVHAYGLSGVLSSSEDPGFNITVDRLTAAWALTRIEDQNKNAITIEYSISESDDGQWAIEMVPERITYGPDRRIEFGYEERTDKVDSFHPGTFPSGSIHMAWERRLSTIRVMDGSGLLRQYTLRYANNSFTGRSQLRSVEECDGGDPADGDPPVCLNALEFEWTSGGAASYEIIDTDITDVARAVRPGRYYIPGDVNGDGLDDLIYRDQENNWKLRFSTGDGFSAPQDAGIPSLGPDEDPRVRPIDYDRDGRLDLMVETPVGDDLTQFSLFRSTGSTYELVFADTKIFTRMSANRIGGLWAGYFVDLDGNGLPDYVGPEIQQDLDGEPDNRLLWRYRLNLGSAFGPYEEGANTVGPLESWNEVAPFDHQIRGVAATGVRPRLLAWTPWADGYGSLRLDEEGEMTGDDGWSFNLPFLREPENTDRRNLHFADINGDGVDDAVYPCTGLKAQLGSGTGFSRLLDGPPDDEIDDCPLVADDNLRVRVVDFTGDGADDILLIHEGKPDNTGDHTRGIQLYTWTGREWDRKGTNIASNDLWLQPYGAIQPMDFNGDGLMDIAQVWSSSPDNTTRFLRLHKRVGDIPDKLFRIKVAGIGARAEIEYTTLANAAVHSRAIANCSYPITCPNRGGSIVSAHSLANGVDPKSPWRRFTHHYWGARADLRGRGWLGFAQHDIRDAERGDALTQVSFDNHTAQNYPDGNGFTTYVYPFAGQPRQITYTVTSGTRDGTPVFYERTTQRALRFQLGTQPATWFTQLDSVTVSDREKVGPSGAWIPLHSRTTSILYDEFQSPREVTTAAPGSDQVDVMTYEQDFDNWLLALPRTRTTTSCTRPDNECQTRQIGFDTYENGNLKTVTVEPEDPAFLLTTTYTYDGFGNVSSVSVADAEGEDQEIRTTSVAYDSLGLYPTSITNALDQTTSQTFHSGLGVVLESRDPHGVVQATMKYDRFGRLREVNHADGGFERYATFGPLIHLMSVPDGSGGTITARTVVMDELGRPVDRTVPAFAGGFSTVRTAYDRLGRVRSMSRPFPTGSEPLHNTTYAYDGLDRPLSIAEPDAATVRHEYIGLESHTYDAEGNHSYTLERPDGLIASRHEDDPESANWLVTGFEYDPFALVSDVIAPDNTGQTMEYDKLGRRTGLVDPSAGTTTSIYNAFGELTEETDGNGALTEYQYDALGRIERVNSPDGLAVHNWDTAANGIGKPASSTSADGVGIVYSYDAIGRPLSTRWNIEGTSYDIDYGYDGIGRPSTITYPALPGAPQSAGRLAIVHSYNPQGYLFQIKNAATNQAYWTAEERDVAGRLIRERYGNQVLTENEYDALGLLRAREVTGPGTVGRLGELAYDYDLNRNVISRGDLFRGRSDTYLYDELDRLKQWSASNGTVQLTATYDYNKVGNLESETVQGVPNQSATYRYGENGAPPHAMTKRNTISYGYDAAGRQVSGPNRTIEYNQWGLPTLLTGGIGEGGPWLTSFSYDAHGTRVLKRDDHNTFVYVGGLFERRVPAAADRETNNLHNIVADGRVVAQVDRRQSSDGQTTNTFAQYLHLDLQGSTTFVTSQAGRAVTGFLGEMLYDPWGRRIKASYVPYDDERWGGPHEGYTGHEHEDELGLINMKGRIYDPKTRRFLTPDPFIQAPLFSQSHNRYSYVWNNPATNTDPSGFECVEGGSECESSFLPPLLPDLSGLRQIPDAAGNLPASVKDLGESLWCGIFSCGGSGAETPISDDNNPTDIVSTGSGPSLRDLLRQHPALACTGVKCLWILRELGTPQAPERLSSRESLRRNEKIAETKAKGDAVRARAPAAHQIFNEATDEIVNRADQAEAAVGVALGSLGNSTGPGVGAGGRRISPFNPTGGRSNCVQCVTSLVDAIESGSFVLPANRYPGAGRSFPTARSALEYISEHTGASFGRGTSGLGRPGDYVVFNGFVDGRPTHVLWARVRPDGSSYFYDPQIARKVAPSSVGRYVAYPIQRE